MRRRAIFMDRDGTINEEVGYVSHLSHFRLLPRSLEAIRLINEAGFLAVVVTNQSGVARGHFPESFVHQVHDRLSGLARAAGSRIDAVYHCPHHPQEGLAPYRQECSCRKPRPGLIEQASRELEIDLAGSYIIGDSWNDIEAGARAGLPGVLVLTGYGRELLENQRHEFSTDPAHVAEDLLDAVRWILQREHPGVGRAATVPEETR